MFNLSHTQLKNAEKSVSSQGGQDGVLEAIFKQIGEGCKRYVEFGARDGLELSNTANLRINFGWEGLLMDVEPLSSLVKKELVLTDNIDFLLHKYRICDIDLLSIDIDGNDWYIWRALNQKPRVVVIEYNSKFRHDESYAIEYNQEHKWEGDDYYGASLFALKKLGENKGYTLVHIVAQFDAFFIRNDLISELYVPPTIEQLLPNPIIAHEKISGKKWVSV